MITFEEEEHSGARYYRYHDSIDTIFGIAKESLGIASIGYI